MFYDFSPIKGLDRLDEFILDSQQYEDELSAHLGITFPDAATFTRDTYDWAIRVCPIIFGVEREEAKIKISGLEANAPFSRKFDSLEELQADILKAYQISFAHYVLAPRFMGKFPEGCCTESAKGVLGSMWVNGLYYALFAASDGGEQGHCYILMPFVFEDFQGLIIVDPTADQFGEKRNEIKIVTIKGLENIWQKSPELVIHFTMFDDCARKEIPNLGFISSYSGEPSLKPLDYLAQAYANPQKLKEL